jgi:hypothetical protein
MRPGVGLVAVVKGPRPWYHGAIIPSVRNPLLDVELWARRGNIVHQASITGSIMKQAWTTCFWVGEPSGKENAYIPNDCSYWDDEWMKHLGGVDDPDPLNGYHPAKFTPKQNPFYFALPYGERDDNDRLKENAEQVPWYAEWRQGKATEPLLKNRWI